MDMQYRWYSEVKLALRPMQDEGLFGVNRVSLKRKFMIVSIKYFLSKFSFFGIFYF